MNLIQQLQQTPKWKEFEEWYKKQDYTILFGNINLHIGYRIGLIELPFEFQKGVFEKFIESQGYHLCTERRKNRNGVVIVPVLYRISEPADAWTQCLVNDNCDSFEQLLMKYFY